MTTVQRIAVGPELARQWIAHSAIAPRRHTIHEDKVHQFAELMRTGRWTDTWVPIMLDRDGNLVNGLHRLSAVVESGCTVVLNSRHRLHVHRGGECAGSESVTQC